MAKETYAAGYCQECGAILNVANGHCLTCGPPAAPAPLGQSDPKQAEDERVRSVENGILQRLSVSAIETFDPEQTAGCNRRWWYAKVDRRTEPSTGAKEKGKGLHSEIDHYARTGEDILSPITRAGMHFIPVIKRDLGEGWAFTEYHFKNVKIGGVPFEGHIDLLNLSGYTLDNEGARVIEEPGTIEVCDWKSSADVAQYGKAARALIGTIQMPGYGMLGALVAEEMGIAVRTVRLSHGYFQTRGKKLAEKRSALFPIETVRSKWQGIETTVEKMKAVARMSNALQVAPNLDACGAYNGCPHASYCPLSGSQVFDSLNNRPKESEPAAMSLAAQAAAMGMVPGQGPALQGQPAYQQQAPAQHFTLPPPQVSHHYQPGTPQPPPHFQQPAQHSPQELAAQRDALMAEEARARNPQAPVYPLCNGCGAQLHQQNTSVLPDRSIVHIGCPARPAQISPPDAPPPNPTTLAQPVPPEMMGQLPPAAQQAAQAHAAQYAAYLAQGQQPAAQQPAQAPAQNAAPPADAPRGRGRPKGGKKKDAPPAGSATAYVGMAGPEGADRSWNLFINCRPVEGMDAESVTPYIEDIARGLAEYHKVPDIRCAPDAKSLGYGAWKGALCACIKQYTLLGSVNDPNHIPPAAYFIDTRAGEIATIAAEALSEVVRAAGGLVVWGLV